MASGQHQLQGGRVATQAPDLQAQRFPPARQGHEEAGPSRQTVTCPRRLAPGGRAEGRRPWKEQAGSLGEAPDTRRRAQSLPVTPVSAPSACGHTAAGRGSGRCVRPRSTAECPWCPFPRLAESHPTTSVQSPLFSALIFSMTLKACLFKGPWVALFWGWHAAIQTSCHHRGLGNAGVLTAAGVPEGVPCERQSQTRLPLF